MSEYILNITCESGGGAKRMDAPNDGAAILAAIQWEDHNADMVLSSEGRVVAEKCDGTWSLKPDATRPQGPVSTRAAVNDFTVKAGWTDRE